MTTHSDTKTKILDLAENLMLALGYSAFSYHHIAEQLGVKNAAIHYHFPSKEHLGAHVINRSKKRFRQLTERLVQSEASLWTQLDAFIDIYQRYLDQDHKVCIIGVSAVAYFTLPESVRKEADALVKELLAWLTQLLEKGRHSGDFSFKGTPQNKATAITSSLAGALQLARISGDDHFYHTVEQIKTDLRS